MRDIMSLLCILSPYGTTNIASAKSAQNNDLCLGHFNEIARQRTAFSSKPATKFCVVSLSVALKSQRPIHET